MVEVYKSSFATACQLLGVDLESTDSSLYDYGPGGSRWLKQEYCSVLGANTDYGLVGERLLNLLQSDAGRLKQCIIQDNSGWSLLIPISLHGKSSLGILSFQVSSFRVVSLEDFNSLGITDSVVVFNEEEASAEPMPVSINLQKFVYALRSGSLDTFNFEQGLDKYIEALQTKESLSIDLSDTAEVQDDPIEVDVEVLEVGSQEDAMEPFEDALEVPIPEVQMPAVGNQGTCDSVVSSGRQEVSLSDYLGNPEVCKEVSFLVQRFGETVVKDFIASGQGFVHKGLLLTY